MLALSVMPRDEMWRRLRRSRALWHSTPANSIDAIFAAGQIIPNHGQFQETYPQSKNSLSRHLGGVSLFDFSTATDDEIKDHGYDYSFVSPMPGRVLIALDRAAVDLTRLLLPSDLRFGSTDPRLGGVSIGKYVRVPYLEAIYLGSIPVGAFRGCFVVVTDRCGQLLGCDVEATPQAPTIIHQIIDRLERKQGARPSKL